MKAQLSKIISMVILLTIIVLPAMAQDGFGDPPPDVPIDGGLTLLIAGGIGYAAKKMRDNRNKK